MASNKITITGGNKVKQILKEFGTKGENAIAQVTRATAIEMEQDALFNLTANNNGKLGQGMFSEQVTPLKWRVGNNVMYAPYVEFGTGTFVQVAPEWKDLAWEFYVNGKGMLRPHPYLYPAFQKARINYQKNIENALKLLTEKYSK